MSEEKPNKVTGEEAEASKPSEKVSTRNVSAWVEETMPNTQQIRDAVKEIGVDDNTFLSALSAPAKRDWVEALLADGVHDDFFHAQRVQRVVYRVITQTFNSAFQKAPVETPVETRIRQVAGRIASSIVRSL